MRWHSRQAGRVRLANRLLRVERPPLRRRGEKEGRGLPTKHCGTASEPEMFEAPW